MLPFCAPQIATRLNLSKAKLFANSHQIVALVIKSPDLFDTIGFPYGPLLLLPIVIAAERATKAVRTLRIKDPSTFAQGALPDPGWIRLF